MGCDYEYEIEFVNEDDWFLCQPKRDFGIAEKPKKSIFETYLGDAPRYFYVNYGTDKDYKKFEPQKPSSTPLEKELIQLINQDGSVETKLRPKNTGFEIENYEGTFHGFKHILESCFWK